jgi:hypothetical protein
VQQVLSREAAEAQLASKLPYLQSCSRAKNRVRLGRAAAAAATLHRARSVQSRRPSCGGETASSMPATAPEIPDERDPSRVLRDRDSTVRGARAGADLRPQRPLFSQNCDNIATTELPKTNKLQVFPLSGIRESNPSLELGKLAFYR